MPVEVENTSVLKLYKKKKKQRENITIISFIIDVP